MGDVHEDLSDGTPSPPKLAPPKTLYTPHRLPPLAQAAPEEYLCALTKALMDEPVRIPGTALAVDRCALDDRVASGNRTWPVTDAPLDADPEDLDVDADAASEISKYKFQALLPKGPPLVPEPRRVFRREGAQNIAGLFMGAFDSASRARDVGDEYSNTLLHLIAH